MPYELYRVGPAGTLTRHASVIRRRAFADALHRAPTPTVGIDINALTVAGVSPHLVNDGLVGLGYDEVCARLDPTHRPARTEPQPVPYHPADASLRLARTAEVSGILMVFGGLIGAVVGLLVVTDTSLARAEQTLAFLGVLAGSVLLMGIGLLLRSAAILLRRPYEGP